MGWGRGLFNGTEPGPVKKEGDGRSPAGAFALGRAFGSADNLPEGAKNFPYLHTLPSTYCIEDSRSKYYNQIVDVADVTPGSRPGWSEMRRADGLFRWGVIVRQNTPNTQTGAGSCVFLHIWRGLGHGTAGCTAMPSDQLESSLRWLDPEADPVLVELPEPVYKELRDAWALP
jgi:L,D-peptidoglycan transpeptidase YkuD (ErfK/YbiS/YcfS/YnhG family)